MKFAIIADIHANLEAFRVVLADIKEQKCTHYACLGDVVGYNANPKECLDMVRKMNIPVVKGNHDEYCSTDGPLDGFNPAAAEAVNWTRKQLTEEDRQWLRELKYLRMVTNFTIVHATLDGPQRWGYVFDKLAAAASFTAGGLHSRQHGARRDLFKIQDRRRKEVFCERRRRRPAARQQSQSRVCGLRRGRRDH
jgi:predicted phosphodiesterase